MTTLSSIQIRGIRGYGYQTTQSLEFQTPLTVIIGQNGAGKSSIVDALHYAIIGPPGGSAAKTLYHLGSANESSVKVRIHTQEGQEAVIERTHPVVGQGTSVLTVKNSDGTQEQIGTGKATSRAHSDDVKTGILRVLGLPDEALFVSVIACTSKNSGWIFDTGSAVAGVLDKVHSTQQFQLLSDSLLEQKKTLMASLKSAHDQLAGAKETLDRPAALEKALRTAQSEQDRLVSRTRSVTNVYNEAQRRMDMLIPVQKTIATITAAVTTYLSRKQAVSADIELPETLNDLYQWRDQIQQNLDSHENTLRERERQLNDLQRQLGEQSAQQQAARLEYQRVIDLLKSAPPSLSDVCAEGANALERAANEVNFDAYLEPLNRVQQRAEEVASLLEEETIHAKQMLADAQSQLMNARATATALNDSARREEEKAAQLRERSIHFSQQMAGRTASLAQISNEISDLEQRLTAANDENRAKASQLEECERSLAGLEAAFAQAQQRLATATKNHEHSLLQHNAAEACSQVLGAVPANEEGRPTLPAVLTDEALTQFHADVIALLQRIKQREEDLAQRRDAAIRAFLSAEVNSQRASSQLMSARQVYQQRSMVATDKHEREDSLRVRFTDLCQQEAVDCACDLSRAEDVQKFVSSIAMRRAISTVKDDVAQLLIDTTDSTQCCPVCGGHDDLTHVKENVEKLLTRSTDNGDLAAVERMGHDLSTAIAEGQAADEAASEARASMTEAAQQAQTFERELEDARNARDALPPPTNAAITLRQELSRFEAMLPSLCGLVPAPPLDEARRELTDAQTVSRTTDQSLVSTRTQLSQLHSDVLALEREISSCSTQIASLRTKRTELSSEDGAAMQAANLEQQAAEASQAARELRAAAEEAQAAVAARERTFRENQLQSSQAEAQHASTLQSVRSLSTGLFETARASVSRLQKVQQQYNDLQQHTSQLADKLVRSRDNVVQVRAALAQASAMEAALMARDEMQRALSQRSPITDFIESGSASNFATGLVALDPWFETSEAVSVRSSVVSLDDCFDTALSSIRAFHSRLPMLENPLATDSEDVTRMSQTVTDMITRAEGSLRSIERELNAVSTESARAETRREQIQLDYTQARNAVARFRDCAADVAVLTGLTDDIEVMSRLVKEAADVYGAERMRELNDVMSSLWREVYSGQDIIGLKFSTGAEAASLLGSAGRQQAVLTAIRPSDEVPLRSIGSGGQQAIASIAARLALAQTFSSSCRILLLDEPSATLDRQHRVTLAASIRRLLEAQINSTLTTFQFILITHDPDFLAALDPASLGVTHGFEVTSGPDGSVLQQRPVNQLVDRLRVDFA